MRVLESRAANVPSNIQLLMGLERQGIDLILAAARAPRFPAGSMMTCQSEPADQLFL